MRIFLLLAVAAAGIATACASTATPYQPAGKNGYGFIETRDPVLLQTLRDELASTERLIQSC